jgi:hypothetical protein
MPSDDRDLWTVALLLIGSHGLGAADEAERRARACLDSDEDGDVGQHGIWLEVAEHCRELLRQRPQAGEQVH